MRVNGQINRMNHTCECIKLIMLKHSAEMYKTHELTFFVVIESQRNTMKQYDQIANLLINFFFTRRATRGTHLTFGSDISNPKHIDAPPTIRYYNIFCVITTIIMHIIPIRILFID